MGAYEAEVHECGFHSSLLDDPTNLFRPEHTTCPVCRGAAIHARRQDNADKDVREGNKSNPNAPDPADGRTLYMRLLTDDQAAEVRAGQSQSRRGRPS